MRGKIITSMIFIFLLVISGILTVNINIGKSQTKQKTADKYIPILDINEDPDDFVLINIIHDIDANLGLQNSLYVDKDFIWAGTYNGTIYMFSRENFSLIHKIQPFDYIAGISGDDNFVYILGKIYEKNPATYIYKYERVTMNLIKQSDSLPAGYGFYSITIDANFIYVGEKSIAVDDKYMYFTFINDYPALIYTKQLLLMKQIPSQTGLNIYNKENHTLVKFIQYEHVEQVPNIYSDDNYLFTAYYNGSVSVYEKNNFTVIKTLVHEGQSYANTVSSDSSYIYIGREAHKINVYTKNTFKFIIDLNSSSYHSEFRTISTYGNYIYGGSSLTPKIFIYRYERTPKPPTITGPTNGKVDVKYNYTSVTFDPDGDNVYYWFDWGDGNNSSWIGPSTSGISCVTSHIWAKKGSYNIQVKAKDVFGMESAWSDPLPITMPSSYKPIPRFLELLFQRFSNAFPLLRQLRGY